MSKGRQVAKPPPVAPIPSKHDRPPKEYRLLYLTVHGIWFVNNGIREYLKYRCLIRSGDDCPTAHLLNFLGLYVEVIEANGTHGTRIKLVLTKRALSFSVSRTSGECYWVTEALLERKSRTKFEVVSFVGNATKP